MASQKMGNEDEKPAAGGEGEAEVSGGAPPACSLCQRGDSVVPLLPIRYEGRDQWVCVRCLPRLIHG